MVKGELTVERNTMLQLLIEIVAIAKSSKNSPTSELVVVVYREGKLFFRSESPVAILQLAMDVEAGPIDEVFRVATNAQKLLACVKQCKQAMVKIQVQKTGLKFGDGIKVATEEPIMFGRLPDAVSKADRVCEVANPILCIERAAHCIAKETDVPLTGRCLTITENRVMAAWVDRSIVVDCKFLPRDREAFVPGKELLHMRAIGEFIAVRQSKEWLVLSSDSNILAVRQQRIPDFVSKVRQLYESTSFVDQIILPKKDLIAPLQTAETMLGKHAIITCRAVPGVADWQGEEEGNQFEFKTAVTVTQGKSYFFGVQIQKFRTAVSNAPFDTIVLKIEELGPEGSVRLHLVDEEAHEIISLDPIHAIREVKQIE